MESNNNPIYAHQKQRKCRKDLYDTMAEKWQAHIKYNLYEYR